MCVVCERKWFFVTNSTLWYSVLFLCISLLHYLEVHFQEENVQYLPADKIDLSTQLPVYCLWTNVPLDNIFVLHFSSNIFFLFTKMFSLSTNFITRTFLLFCFRSDRKDYVEAYYCQWCLFWMSVRMLFTWRTFIYEENWICFRWLLPKYDKARRKTHVHYVRSWDVWQNAQNFLINEREPNLESWKNLN